MGQDVLTIDLVVEHVEAVSRLVLRLAIQLDLKFPYLTRCCQTHRQSPFLPSFTSTIRSMGPSLRRHYPTSQVLWPTPTPSLTAALSSDVRSRDPRQTRASPTRRRSPSSACRAQYPGGPDQVLVGWRVARSRAGFFPVRAAFPSSGAGRRPHRYFEACSSFTRVTACRVAHPPYVGFIARLRPGRLPGSGARKMR